MKSFQPFVHLFFMDGVGLGPADPAVNPFMTANLPHLTQLLGPGWFLTQDVWAAERATLVPTDANLGIDHRPQSATGQATILTGRNVPALVGEHYGPKPNAPVNQIIQEGTLFHEVVAAGGRTALLTAYPQGYFAAVQRGKRLLSAVPLAATSAGLGLMTAVDLQAGRAVSPEFTNRAWREHLGYADMPLLTLHEAGERLAHIGATYHFSFFEHWPSDQVGHRGTLAEAVTHLEMVDEALGGLLAGWEDAAGLLIITSDHGNIEEKNHRQHTRNPVPTILVGQHHRALAAYIHSLADIATVVRQVLKLPQPSLSH